MQKRTYISLERLVVVLVLFFSLGRDFFNRGAEPDFDGQVFRSIKVLLSFGLVFLSSKPSLQEFDYKILVGLLASFVAPAFLSVKPAGFDDTSSLSLLLLCAACLFYSILILVGIISLRDSFGILPALRKVVTGGVYQLVRHPIYSCYLHLLEAVS